MPEQMVDVIALKTFAGAGVFAVKGQRISFPKRWLRQYSQHGLVREASVKPQSTETPVETASVEPQASEPPVETTSVGHDFGLLTRMTEKRAPSKATIDDLEQRGPYYVLPDGNMVRGRADAEKALAAYYAEHESDS